MTDRLYLARLLRCSVLFIALAGAVRAKTVVFRDGQVLLPVFVAAESVPEERAAAEELMRGRDPIAFLLHLKVQQFPMQPWQLRVFIHSL
jgi:hypothetical protein